MLKKTPMVSIFLLAIIGLWLLNANIYRPETADAYQQRPESFADLAEKVMPAVVNISTSQVIKTEGRSGRGVPGNPQMREFDDFFKRFFEYEVPPETTRTSLGSGFIWGKEGYIVTNNHVVESASEIRVVLAGGKEYEARIVGRDPKTDIALIKIDPEEDLYEVRLGDSDKLRIGDWVIAIGNPFGIGQTVTAGIVSAKGRQIGVGPYDSYIQTDAAINQGNSGGPLFNNQGDVVGINSAIFSLSGGNEGIGFSIPINLAKQIIPQLKEKGYVSRGWLGVMIQTLSDDLAEQFGLKEAKGALVANVTAGGPADKAGIGQGDVIIEFDGKPINEMRELPIMVAATAVGKEVKVKVIRDGKIKTLKVKIESFPGEEKLALAGETAPGDETKTPKIEEMLGMKVQSITPDIARQLELENTDGVVVSGVMRKSPADKTGLRRGDVITEIDRKQVTSIDDYQDSTRLWKPGEKHLFVIHRGQQDFFMVMKIEG
jgi:serine protease Do